jgi:hypothetical protein
MTIGYPPRASTTLRQGSDSFVLFSRRQAFISGGLPICVAQSRLASERQASCSWRLGPDCDSADDAAAAVTMAMPAEFLMMDQIMERPVGYRFNPRSLVGQAIRANAMFMAGTMARARS